MPRLLPLSLLLLAAAGGVHAAPTPITIEQAMADPDWIGPPVESAWWSWNSQQVEYQLKRNGSPVRDTFRQPLAGGAAQQVADDQRGTLDVANPVYDRNRQRTVFVRNGDVFVRDLRSGALTQLTRSSERASAPGFANDGGVIWRIGHNWFHWTAAAGATQVATLKAEKNPDEPPKADVLREQQLRTLETLRRDRAQREALKAQEESWRRADATRAPGPIYLGADVEIVDSVLSPDARHLIVVTKPKGFDEGRGGKMPLYVTESGYEEAEDTRTRVGRNNPEPHALWLVDAATGTLKPLSLDGLPGIANDPLAALRKAAGKDALKGNRPLQVLRGRGNSGIRWSDDGSQAAIMLRANDNKDRWIASVSPASAKLETRHRLTDNAWINWGFNDFGWMGDGRTLWLLSEESGFSHLYTQQGGGKPQALTGGRWEASMPVQTADGRGFYFLCNPQAPHDYEVCTVDTGSRQVKELTSLDGVEDFSLSPDGGQLLVRYSASYLPPQLAVVPAAGGQARVLTDTRSAEFKAREWIQPQLVQVPSRHGAGHVWAKYYGPQTLEPGKKYPIAMFVHGAGYLQNVHQRYPAYFREQMFHNLLVQQGYIVLDMDYRGSEGYGRDWRTAIYRNMGHPELEDYLDGLDWLAQTRQGDRDRAGIYGGSYGGFMTFMALFRAPGTFKAGAALRPVVDWHQYNHGYTSNILNTPDIDPEAYRKSSPIEYAEGLQDHLLIAHGMMDDNVFFQDSINLTQRLIELHKDNWTIAPYPLERHGYVRADSWLDQYKRILKLFEENLK
ncbi:S9 family peptidase [Flavobacterium sp. MXW15]|uniref:S9 family peptidase n=1 Tax=Xanthomonas chitinilytica TaxID=2989819 RepID=A0ABT3JXV4_9XANT|nr:S9 family peptidase [Xanthomonas sp. H13-6]MCW4455906.1 S9 family peptidase [Flavobacterium sp. MXW15]MCW4473281.1 S9 family peptidase [Xanthomonas sp. H13-6]